MKRKPLIITGLAVILSVILLSGCGNSNIVEDKNIADETSGDADVSDTEYNNTTDRNIVSNSDDETNLNNDTVTTDAEVIQGIWSILPEIEETPVENLRYSYSNEYGGISVTGVKGEIHKLRIPATIDGEPVVAVDLKSTDVSELVVPDTVKYMNINKSGIRYINYPDGVIVENEKEGYTNIEGLYLCSDYFSSTVLDKCSNPVVIYNNETYDKTNFADLDKQLKPYRVKNGALINCYNTVSTFEIPSDVTSISDNAFCGCTELEKVIIPDGVTEIGEKAFSGCTGLTEIVIPDSVTMIRSSAFADCSSLTSVTIGNGVTKSGVSVFKNCKNVKHLSYNSGNFVSSFPDLETVIIGDSIYEIGESEFEGYRNLSSVTIGSGVAKIDISAFEGCIALADITIPDGVISVGEYAFKDCQSLTSVVIPESVTELNTTAFEGCKNVRSLTYGTEMLTREIVNCFPDLDTVVIDSSVNKISPHLFSNLPLLKNVTISEGVLIIGSNAFDNCTKIESIVIPDSVTDIGDNAFKGNISMTDLTIGKGVLKINNAAFLGCKELKTIICNNNLIHRVIDDYYNDALETIIIGDYVTELDLRDADNCKNIIVDENNTVFSSVDGVLYSKDKQTLILCPDKKEGSHIIADGTVTIGENAFADCKILTEITIPDSVTRIGEYSFLNCVSLTGITIPDSVTRIDKHAFECCTGLTRIAIPDSVTELADSAFLKCDGLAEISIGKGLLILGDSAFSGCRNVTKLTYNSDNVTRSSVMPFINLKSVVIGDSVTAIPYNMFNDRDTLTDVTISNSVITIDKSAFGGCDGLTEITIPDNVTTIGEYAFSNCKNLTKVKIGRGVNIICAAAFKGCERLSDINIPNSVTELIGGAFNDCKSLTTLSLPDGIVKISSYCFDGCINLMITYKGNTYKAKNNGRNWHELEKAINKTKRDIS